MTVEPGARQGDGVLAGMEMRQETERAKAVRPAAEVMPLTIGIDAERTLATKAVIAGTVGDRRSAGRVGDVEEEALEPGALGSR